MKVGSIINRRQAQFKDRLKEAMNRMGITQTELVRITNIPKSAMSQYLSGAFVPKADRLSVLAKALNVQESWLLGYSTPIRRKPNQAIVNDDTDSDNPVLLDIYDYLDTFSQEELKAELERLKVIDSSNIIRPISTKRLPVLGNVACGEPIFADEQRNTYIDVDYDVDADFCLTAKGDSMINARIFDGDILFVKSQPTVEDGEIAVVLIEDEATVKRVYYNKEDSILTLVPENPTYKPMRYQGEQLNNIRILGKVVFGQYNI